MSGTPDNEGYIEPAGSPHFRPLISSTAFSASLDNSPETLVHYGGLEQGPWSKREEEDHVDYARFTCYLLMGPSRSLSRLETYLDKMQPQLAVRKQVYATTSSKFKWVSRCEAWDDAVMRRTQPQIWQMEVQAQLDLAESVIQYRHKVVQQHIEDAADLRYVFNSDIAELKRYVKSGRVGDAPGTLFSRDKLIPMWAELVKTERTTAGLNVADQLKSGELVHAKTVDALVAVAQAMLQTLPPETAKIWASRIQEQVGPTEARLLNITQ